MSSHSQSFVYQNILATCVLHDHPADETVIDEEAPIVVEMNKQFSSPGSTVNLSGQDLSDWISMQSLCARLSRSDNAKSIIYLDHCNLGRHGAAIVSRSFTHVLIRAGNYVAKWLPLMHQNGRIIVLSMINNDIGPDGAAAVATMLRVNTSLRELNLRFNSLKSDGAQYLASALYVNNSLRFLCLSGNELCGLDGVSEQVYDLAGISALFRSLHVNTRLKTLKIAENDIGNDGAKHLADALRENKCLSILDIHGNDLFGVLEGEIFEEGASDVTQSENLNDEKNDSSHRTSRELQNSGNTDDNGESIDHSQGDLPNQHVELKYELSGLEGGGSLLTAIGESNYLSSVDISWNEMGPKGAILFGASLLNNSTLTYLDIHGNYIGDDGVSALCLYLKGEYCKLSVLYMQQVGMTPCGALLVAEVLSTNKTLTKLNVAHNIIESTGAYKLALSLRSNAVLKDLNLRNCHICSEGISHLANMLQYNRSLTVLNLSNNDIEDDGAIAISVTLSLNPTLETLDMSNYQPISSVTVDPDDLPLAVSTHSKKSAQLSESQSPRPLKQSHQSQRIGESGIEALAHAITGSIRLSQLILNGHDLSPKMCLDLLNAMNESRVCTIIADFKSYKWKEVEVRAAMKAEREFLSSCYTPKSLRIHLCGQTNSKKQRMLRGWYDHQQLPFWTGLFGSSADLTEVYGLEILQLSLQNRAADLNFWCYDGLNQLHELHRLHLRATPLSVSMIAVSSVGLTGQCRSAAQVAAEAVSWIRLLMTFGHQVRDISVVITNGLLFDKAWHGVDPSCVGVPSAIDELGHSRSSVDPSVHSNLSSEKKDDEMSSIPESSLGASSLGANQQTKCLDESSSPDKRMRFLLDNNSSHALEAPSEEKNPLSVHNPTQADLRRKFEESIHEQISNVLGWKKTPQFFCWDEGENGAMPSKIDQWLSDRYKSLSQHVQVPNICSIIREHCLPSLRNYQLQPQQSQQPTQLLSHSLFSSHPQQIVSMKHLLKQCKQHIKCLQLVELRQACQWLHLLGDIVIYDTMELDSYEIDMWNYLRIKDANTPFDDEHHQHQHHLQHDGYTLSTHHPSPLLHSQTPELENDIKTEINQKLRTIESKRLKIQLDLELMKSQAPKRNCKIILNPHWFSRYILLGFIYQSPESNLTIPSPTLASSPLLTSSSSTICTPSLLTNGTTSCIPTSQPWCPHEYKYTFQQIYDYLLPYTKTNQLNSTILTPTELLIALEVQKLGVILPSISSFCLPCRLYGNKLKWLGDRQVMKMSLSQYSGYGSRNNQNEMTSLTSAIGKRIKCKFPYIFPPSTFSCLQSHILHTWITEKETSWKYHRVVLWERGIGITIEQPPIIKVQKSFFDKNKKSSPETVPDSPPEPPAAYSDEKKESQAISSGASDPISSPPQLDDNDIRTTGPSVSGSTCVKDFPSGTGSGNICILIEMTSKTIQPDWTQSPDSVIDIMIWGEGVCDNSQLPSLLSQFVEYVFLTCQVVCQGALRSEGASVDALQPPVINWLKVYNLRPGCFLHTLASHTNERNCGEYLEDADFNDPLESPILVMCHHLQPRLLKSHLINGYILADSPGQGKGLLRSVYSSLERYVETTNQENGKSSQTGALPGTPIVSSPTSPPGAGAMTGTNVHAGNAEVGFSYDDYIYDIQSSIIASE